MLFVSITLPELSSPLFSQTTTYQWAIVPAASNPPWKFITYQWMHASWGHLLSNMWYLGIFGWILENALGGIYFLGLILGLGALAVLPEYIFQADPSLPIIGASGSIAVAMGAATVLFPSSRVKLLWLLIPFSKIPNSIFVPIRYVAYFWLSLQISGLAYNVWVSPKPVAYATHLAGFGLGGLAGLFLRWKRKDDFDTEIELSGRDLSSFYEAIDAFKVKNQEQASHIFEALSEKHVFSLPLQLKLFRLALVHQQKDLADRLWKRLLPHLLILRRAQTLLENLQAFTATFGSLPTLEVQQRVQITHLLRSHRLGEEVDALRLYASNAN